MGQCEALHIIPHLWGEIASGEVDLVKWRVVMLNTTNILYTNM